MDANRCVVTTSKRSMLIYEVLYILGLLVVLTGAAIDYLLGTTPQYLMPMLIIAVGMFASATILWALDRKCEPLAK